MSAVLDLYGRLCRVERVTRAAIRVYTDHGTSAREAVRRAGQLAAMLERLETGGLRWVAAFTELPLDPEQITPWLREQGYSCPASLSACPPLARDTGAVSPEEPARGPLLGGPAAVPGGER